MSEGQTALAAPLNRVRVSFPSNVGAMPSSRQLPSWAIDVGRVPEEWARFVTIGGEQHEGDFADLLGGDIAPRQVEIGATALVTNLRHVGTSTGR